LRDPVCPYFLEEAQTFKLSRHYLSPSRRGLGLAGKLLVFSGISLVYCVPVSEVGPNKNDS